jgi:hypothetical protein
MSGAIAHRLGLVEGIAGSNRGRGMIERTFSARVGLALSGIAFTTAMGIFSAPLYGQTSRPQGQVFLGYSGTAGDPGELAFVDTFLRELANSFGNNAYLYDPVKLDTWSADNAVDIVSAEEVKREARDHYRTVFDHYIVALMETSAEPLCGDDVNMTSVTFELGRFSLIPDKNKLLDYSSWPRGDVVIHVGHGNNGGTCGKNAQIIVEDGAGRWTGRGISETTQLVIPGIIKSLPELRGYTVSNPFTFFVSCLEVDNQYLEPERTVIDILTSKALPEELRANFFADLLQDLVMHPNHQDIIVPWKFVKPDIDVTDRDSIREMCLKRSRGGQLGDQAYVQLNSKLRPGHNPAQVILEIQLIDNALRNSFADAKQPRQSPIFDRDFLKWQDDGIEKAAFTIVRHCAPGLSAIASDESTIDNLAFRVHSLVDHAQHPDESELKCDDEKK